MQGELTMTLPACPIYDPSPRLGCAFQALERITAVKKKRAKLGASDGPITKYATR